jgi:Uncharacterized conserved protein (COG2071)
MRHLLKRHLLPITGYFDFVLSLTYSIPAVILARILPPGLRLDEWNGLGFLAAAFVQAFEMRPTILPRFAGASYFFAGYRVFCRYQTNDGRELRGLRILRSDTDKTLMVRAGNLVTHYNYHLADIDLQRSADVLHLRIVSRDGNGDAEVIADLNRPADFLPEGSPFLATRDARRFVGPMPFTFGYEPETNSIIRVKGLRKGWKPRLIPVLVKELTFLNQSPFAETTPVLSSCFYTEGINYYWKRGIREQLA